MNDNSIGLSDRRDKNAFGLDSASSNILTSNFHHSRHRLAAPKDHRQIIYDLLWLIGTVRLWRDLPAEYGSWQTVSNRNEKRAINYLATLTIAAVTLWLSEEVSDQSHAGKDVAQVVECNWGS